jgi:hypothetical protein
MLKRIFSQSEVVRLAVIATMLAVAVMTLFPSGT